MGLCGSKSKPTKEERHHHEDNRKIVYILYSGSDQTHKRNTRSFRDALQDHGGNLKIEQLFDVNNGQNFDAVQRLKERNQNVTLLSVDEEGAASLGEAIDKDWIQQHAMPRVLSVSFGTKPPQDSIKILQHRKPMDKKDFCFEFSDVNYLNANHFSDSPVMNQLVTTLMAAE